MPQYKTNGVILKSHNFGETDRLITIFSEKQGKITTIAKGVRRPGAKFSGNLELFCYSNLLIAEGRNLDIICSAESIDCFSNIREDLQKTALVFYILEVVDKFTVEKVRSPKLLKLILIVLNKLKSNKVNHNILKNYFVLNLLSQVGFKPDLSSCPIHKKNNHKFCFSNQEGGLLCGECAKIDPTAFPVTISAIKVLRLMLENNIDIIDRIPKDFDFGQINKIVQIFLRYLSEKEIYSERFINRIGDDSANLGRS